MATPSADFIPQNDGRAQVDPATSMTGGQKFLPNSATTGGQQSENAFSQTPINQDDTTVTPEEQRQYDDFVTRCKLFINDPRPPHNNQGMPQTDKKAPRDVIIEHLNTPGGQQAATAVGRTAAQVITLITNNAKAAGFPYPPDVIFHGADEVISDLYQIGVAAGVIKNPPPDNSEQEQHLLAMAKMYAAQFYGQAYIDSGQDTDDMKQQAHQYITDQMQKEAQSGALENWNPSQHFSRQQIVDFMHKAAAGKAKFQGGIAPPTTIADYAQRGHPQLVPPGGAPSAAPASDDGSGGGDGSAPPDDGSGGGSPDQSAAPPDQSGGPQ